MAVCAWGRVWRVARAGEVRCVERQGAVARLRIGRPGQERHGAGCAAMLVGEVVVRGVVVEVMRDRLLGLSAGNGPVGRNSVERNRSAVARSWPFVPVEPSMF